MISIHRLFRNEARNEELISISTNIKSATVCNYISYSLDVNEDIEKLEDY